MRFLHLGDLHLGKSLNDYDLIEDQRYILDQILELADDRSVDGVLIAGDVYDKAVPSEAATRLLDHFLIELAKRKISVFMVSGNHDSDDRLNFGSALFETNRIFISAVFDGTLHKKSFTGKDQSAADTERITDVYMLPFVKASQVRHYFPDEKIENYDDAVRAIIRNTPIDRTHVNILVAHQFVAGREDPSLAGSESVGTRSVGMVEKIGYDCFDDFDYVALGHIHSPQRVGKDTVRYAGSPLKYSLSEVHNTKSVPLITVLPQNASETAEAEEKKPINAAEKAGADEQKPINASETAEDEEKKPSRIKTELITLKPRRDMRHLKGPIKVLLDKANVKDTEDFIYATLTDEDIINDAMGIFRQVYPNTVRIDYCNSHTKEIEQVDISRITESRSFTELIGDFYSLMYGGQISDEEMSVMRKIANELGISTSDSKA